MRYRDAHRVSAAASRHAAEFRRCLLDLDVAGIRRLWNHVSPHLPQPATNDDALHTMHMARVAMTTLPADQRSYSQAWLAERQRVATGVGVIVIAPEHRIAHGQRVHDAMVDAVQASHQAGLDLDRDAVEVRRRMLAARDRA